MSFEIGRREWRTLLAVVAAAAALASLWLVPPAVEGTGDERDYLRAAVHFSRSGVFSVAPLEDSAPRADAYREPAYPFLLAAWWRVTGADVPATATDQVVHPAWRTVPGVRPLGVLALVVAAGAAGLAASGAGAGRAASLAASAIVLASPGLRQAALTMGPEAHAAALVSLAGLGLVRAAAGGGYGAVALAGMAAGLGVLARAGGVVLLAAGALVLLAFPGVAARRSRAARAAVFALLALGPGVLWAARNWSVTGHWVLADRGGQVMWTRAELDRQIAAEGVLPAILAWTPLESARRYGERRWPAARYTRYEWTGEGNFFTRSIRSWQSERHRSGDPIATDRELGRAALREFLAHPVDHALAGVAVGWRGLFAERSPAILAPVDLRFALGLTSAAGVVLLLPGAVRRRDGPAAALVAAPLALFLFHAALTEFLTRFGVPGLPLAWAALVVVLSPRAFRLDRAGAATGARRATGGAATPKLSPRMPSRASSAMAATTAWRTRPMSTAPPNVRGASSRRPRASA